MTTPKLSVDDPEFVEKIIYEVKSQGNFDAFRKECLADVDTQPAFQNLHSRVEDSVQKYLNRQVWTPETNKNRLREDMRYSIVRAGYLENGVTRIVDQVVEQKMSYIQSKVEEILYKYVGIAKPIKKEKLLSEALEVETDLPPTDLELEQVSPDSDKKSLPEAMDMEESQGEEIEEEIVEDEDFESPAFEPIEAITVEKNENSNSSAISGLTSQDSIENENKSDPGPSEQLQESQLSQISSVLDMSQEASAVTAPAAVSEDIPMAEIPPETQEEPEAKETEKSNFDLNKDVIEFTGNERKSISEDLANEPEKVLQPQDVPSNTMEIDNLYENDTTDSSETRMEIDLKDETTQGTIESTKVEEESSQDSTISKEKSLSESKKDSRRHHHKSDRPRDEHKSSSSSHKSRHHHRSSSSRSHHDDKHKKSDGKSSSSSHKKSSSDKDRSSSSRRDHDKDKKSSRDESSKSKHRDRKSDDHQQEKSSRRRKSDDHDSNEGNADKLNLSAPAPISSDAQSVHDNKTESTNVKPADESQQQVQEAVETKPVKLEKILSDNCEISLDSRSSTSSGTKKEQKSSILVKYDYLKSTPKANKIEDGFCGFAVEKLPENPWFACLRKETAKKPPKKTKPKAKPVNSSSVPPSDSSNLQNGIEETSECKSQTIAQQQRYNDDDLYKPRFDFGNRSRRRGQVTDETSDEPQGLKSDEVPT